MTADGAREPEARLLRPAGPAEGRLGWHWGGDGWAAGEFFRYRLTGLEPSAGPPPRRSR